MYFPGPRIRYVKGLEDAPITKDSQSSDVFHRVRRHKSRICYGIPNAVHSLLTTKITPKLRRSCAQLLGTCVKIS